VVHRLGHVDALDPDAGLACVGHRAPGRGVGRRVQVGVRPDQQGVLAAAFGHHGGQGVRGGGHHLARGGRGAGEGDLGHAAAGQRVAGRAGPGDQLENGLELTEDAKRLAERPDQRVPGGRGQLRRLEHDRVPGRQRVGDRAHRGEHRVVPRPDHADHAERLVLHRGGLVDGREPAADPARAQHPAGVLGGPVDVQDGQDDLEFRVVKRLAGFGVHELGEPVQVPGQVRLPGQQPDPPPGPAELGPPHGGLATRGHGGIDLTAPVHGEGGQHFPSRRVDCLKHR